MAMEACLKGFRTNKGEAGSSGLDKGGLVKGTTMSVHTTPDGINYQLVRPTPHSGANNNPVSIVVYVFGGGFVAGSPTQYLPLTSQLAQRTKGATKGAWVAVPFYSLNTPYPIPLDQVLSVARYLRHAHAGTRMLIGGDSAGGTIACGAALKSPKLFDGLFLFSPWLDLASNLRTYSSRAYSTATRTGDPIFTTPSTQNKRDSRALAMHYLGRKSRLADPIANPIRATHRLLSNLPPVFITVGDRETILGGSERFMSKLQALGRTQDALQVYSGMWHVFPMYSQGCGSGHRLAPAVAALTQTRAFIHGTTPNSLPPLALPSVLGRLVLLPLVPARATRKTYSTKRKSNKSTTRRRRRS